LITLHEAGATYHCVTIEIFKGMAEALEQLLWRHASSAPGVEFMGGVLPPAWHPPLREITRWMRSWGVGGYRS
jgi:hypothetical protein